jgi:hypothetical protein
VSRKISCVILFLGDQHASTGVVRQTVDKQELYLNSTWIHRKGGRFDVDPGQVTMMNNNAASTYMSIDEVDLGRPAYDDDPAVVMDFNISIVKTWHPSIFSDLLACSHPLGCSRSESTIDYLRSRHWP